MTAEMAPGQAGTARGPAGPGAAGNGQPSAAWHRITITWTPWPTGKTAPAGPSHSAHPLLPSRHPDPDRCWTARQKVVPTLRSGLANATERQQSVSFRPRVSLVVARSATSVIRVSGMVSFIRGRRGLNHWCHSLNHSCLSCHCGIMPSESVERQRIFGSRDEAVSSLLAVPSSGDTYD